MKRILEISIGQFSDKGPKPDNEDFYGYIEPAGSQLEYKGIAVAISDGMSGSEDGKQASHACIIGFLSDYFSTPESWTVDTSVHKVLSATNNWLYSNGHSQYQSARGMVATLSILILKSNTAHLYHIGDSRIYRLRESHLELLTNDHRVPGPRGQTFLNRAMGIEPHLNVDCRKFALQKNDIFLLTTDGVHEFVANKSMTAIILDHPEDLQSAAEAIIDLAVSNDSNDNLTCQVVRIDNLPAPDNSEFAKQNANNPFRVDRQ